jgi:rhodanese-related sulfurtransferase
MNDAAVPSIEARTAEARLGSGEEPAPLLIDVREPDEFAAVRAVGAIHMPLSTLEPRIGELPRDRPLFVICHSGKRSGMVTGYLLAKGWTDVQNVTGGMIAWEFNKLPTRSGPTDPSELTLPG